MNALFDQLPEGTVMSLTLVVKPQDVLEDQLNRLARKAIGENLAPRPRPARMSKRLARSSAASTSCTAERWRSTCAVTMSSNCTSCSVSLTNALLGAGLQPVREGDEVAACNSYLRWLPMAYNPARDTRNWYTRLMFAQHLANLVPVWGRSTGTGHPGITLFNRGGRWSFDPVSRLDRAMNGVLLLLAPQAPVVGDPCFLLMQVMAVYRPRLFIVEAGNSFGLQGHYFATQGLSVNKVQLKPGAPVSLAPFADPVADRAAGSGGESVDR